MRAKFPQKADYLRKPLRSYKEGRLNPLFTDQVVSISFIDEVVVALDIIIEKGLKGVLHAGSHDRVKFDELINYFLTAVVGEAKTTSWSIKDFWKTGASPVRYPMCGGLCVEESEGRLGMKFSSWKEIVAKLVEQGVGE